MGKATPTKKGKSSTAVAAPEPRIFKGWATLAEFLQKDSTEQRSESSDTTHLIHIISCSEVNRGFQAEVNWYTGGNSYVTLPNTVAERKPGLYLAKGKRIRWHYPPWMARLTSITHLRWLGTRSQCAQIAKEKGTDLATYGLSWFGKTELELLMEMLSANADSECVSAVVAASQF